MNIQTAAQYMKYGYKCRRLSWLKEWGPGDFIYWNSELDYFSNPEPNNQPCEFFMEDLMADDWEIVKE